MRTLEELSQGDRALSALSPIIIMSSTNHTVMSDPQTDYWLECEKEIQNLADDLDVTYMCAVDITYLRTRSRWTQELENELIRLHDVGTPPNMCEFGSTKSTQEQLMRLANSFTN